MALSEQQQQQKQPPPPAPPSSRKRLRMEATTSSPSFLHIPHSTSSSFLEDLDSSLPLPSSPAHRRRLSEIMHSLQLAIQSALSPPLPPSALRDRDDDAVYEILSSAHQGPVGASSAQASDVAREATLLETLIPPPGAQELVPVSDGSGSSEEEEEEEEEDAEDLQRFLAQLSADSFSELSAATSELWGDDLFGI